jgi:hypothetical protein
MWTCHPTLCYLPPDRVRRGTPTRPWRLQRLTRKVLVNPWLQAGLSLVVGLLTASGALVGVRLSVQGTNRAEWWRRFTWAADLALDSSSVKRVAGLKLLAKLAQSDLAQEDDYLLLDAFQERVLDELLNDAPGLQEGGGDDD